MMSSVILLFMLMILLSVPNVIRHLICGNNQNWLLNLNLIYKTLWTGAGSDWLISMLEKQLDSFDQSNNTGAINVNIDGSVYEDKSSFKMLGFTFSSKLDWGSYIISIAKTASKKILAFILFLLRLLCISLNLIIQSCMESGNELESFLRGCQQQIGRFQSPQVQVECVFPTECVKIRNRNSHDKLVKNNCFS